MLTVHAMKQALKKAIENSGGVTKLAKTMGGISSQAISQWKQVPAGRVADVERASGISRYDLRPDIFGDAPKQEQSA